MMIAAFLNSTLFVFAALTVRQQSVTSPDKRTAPVVQRCCGFPVRYESRSVFTISVPNVNLDLNYGRYDELRFCIDPCKDEDEK